MSLTIDRPLPAVRERTVSPATSPHPRRTRAAAGRVARRLAHAVVVVWAAVTLTFIAVQAAPGETINTLLGANANDPSLRAQVIREW
ncbi:MAG: hypothetical protein LBK72_06880, partial [Bifidobacteriaceae bacterium]|nr:hypothetical protein [Bifidobacteriaceae bacterium]